jgi:hypothetical protein
MTRVAALAVLMFTLAGCALPPAFQIASLMAEGISLGATGKTTTDHIISAARQQDCALYRALNEDPICRDTTVARRPIGDVEVDDAAMN